jgi:hypothetical protein
VSEARFKSRYSGSEERPWSELKLRKGAGGHVKEFGTRDKEVRVEGK